MLTTKLVDSLFRRNFPARKIPSYIRPTAPEPLGVEINNSTLPVTVPAVTHALAVNLESTLRRKKAGICYLASCVGKHPKGLRLTEGVYTIDISKNNFSVHSKLLITN